MGNKFLYIMEGVIKNFKRGRHTYTGNQMVVYVESVKSKEDASKLIGKKVTWKSTGGKEINGEVRSAHGNKGALRVMFSTGMPGQAIGTKVAIS